MGEATHHPKPSGGPSCEGSHGDASTSSRLKRFVILVSPISTRPTRLLQGLYDRGMTVRIVHDAAMAMAELALFNAQVLIVHEVQAVSSLEPLLAAVRMYHPGVLCWQHEPAGPGGRERLSSFQCPLKTHQSPRFTPAPADLKPSSAPTRSPSARSRPAPSAKINAPAEGSRHDAAVEESAHASNAHASNVQSSAVAPSQTNTQLNGHANGQNISQAPNQTNGHVNGVSRSGHDVSQADNQPHARLSWGQRLAAASGNASDQAKGSQAQDAFSPLLSPEEIELLRGPIEDDDAK